MCKNSLIVLSNFIICIFFLLNGLGLEFLLSDFDFAIPAFCWNPCTWCYFPHAFIFKLSLSLFGHVSWMKHWAGVSIKIICVTDNAHQIKKVKWDIFTLINFQDGSSFVYDLFQCCCLISLHSLSSVFFCVWVLLLREQNDHKGSTLVTLVKGLVLWQIVSLSELRFETHSHLSQCTITWKEIVRSSYTLNKLAQFSQLNDNSMSSKVIWINW